MKQPSLNAKRAIYAAKAIIDDRDFIADPSQIMVTLEHTVATVLLALYADPKLAAGMLNEGLVPGVEARLAQKAAKASEGK